MSVFFFKDKGEWNNRKLHPRIGMLVLPEDMEEDRVLLGWIRVGAETNSEGLRGTEVCEKLMSRVRPELSPGQLSAMIQYFPFENYILAFDNADLENRIRSSLESNLLEQDPYLDRRIVPRIDPFKSTNTQVFYGEAVFVPPRGMVARGTIKLLQRRNRMVDYDQLDRALQYNGDDPNDRRDLHWHSGQDRLCFSLSPSTLFASFHALDNSSDTDDGYFEDDTVFLLFPSVRDGEQNMIEKKVDHSILEKDFYEIEEGNASNTNTVRLYHDKKDNRPYYSWKANLQTRSGLVLEIVPNVAVSRLRRPNSIVAEDGFHLEVVGVVLPDLSRNSNVVEVVANFAGNGMLLPHSLEPLEAAMSLSSPRGLFQRAPKITRAEKSLQPAQSMLPSERMENGVGVVELSDFVDRKVATSSKTLARDTSALSQILESQEHEQDRGYHKNRYVLFKNDLESMGSILVYLQPSLDDEEKHLATTTHYRETVMAPSIEEGGNNIVIDWLDDAIHVEQGVYGQANKTSETFGYAQWLRYQRESARFYWPVLEEDEEDPRALTLRMNNGSAGRQIRHGSLFFLGPLIVSLVAHSAKGTEE